MDDLTDGLVEPSYDIQNVEIRHNMIVITFTDPDAGAKPFPIHSNQVIPAGQDPEIDQRVTELIVELQGILDAAHVANRRPPDTRPAGRRAPVE